MSEDNYTGDFWAIPVRIKKNKVNYPVNGAVISAAVVQVVGEQPKQVITETVQSDTAAGADWENGLVIVEFSEAQTAALTTYTNLELEIQITENGRKRTWPRKSLTVKKGSIT